MSSKILITSKIEYVSHAVNFCKGCAHGCLYPCYSQRMKGIAYHPWRHEPKPILNAPELLRDQLTRIRKIPTEVLLCSSHDAYQPNGNLPTRQVLEVLAEAEMPVWVLTKGCHPLPRGGGLLPVRDFDLLQGPGCRFGVTITTLNETMRERWEPGASAIRHRLAALANAKIKGIATWVSVEPALPGIDWMRLADCLQGLADWVVIGKWNYNSQSEVINWSRVQEQAQEAFEVAGIPFLIKSELASSPTPGRMSHDRIRNWNL